MDNKKKYENFKVIVDKLKENLISDLVSVNEMYPLAISLYFSNRFRILISSSATPESRKTISSNDLLLIYDEGFINTSKLLFDPLYKQNHESGMGMLKEILNAFSKEPSVKFENIKKYRSLHFFELKYILSDYFGLGLDPKREFFILLNDQIQSRFLTLKAPSPKSGSTITIIDDSAIMFESRGERVIDLFVGIHYKTATHIYTSKIFHYEDCDENDPDRTDTIYNGESKTFRKMVLNEGVDLENSPRYSYKSADQMELTLKKSGGIYYFEDSQGRIEIHHPDLLIYLLD